MNKILLEEEAVIRREIMDREITDKFNDVWNSMEGDSSSNHLEELLSRMAFHSDNRAFWEIKSHRPILGNFIVFLKRVERKLIKWYIEPICNRQSDFNHTTYDVVNEMLREIVALELKIKLLEKNIEKLNKR